MIKNKCGFTIIEMLLSMAFVSSLMLAVAIMTMQMVSMMNKGATFRDLNSASRTINDDFTRTLNSSSISSSWDGTPRSSTESGSSYIRTNGAGAFCTGDVSYLWNLASQLNNNKDSTQLEVRYKDTKKSEEGIRLIKISDKSKRYCSDKGAWSSIDRNDGRTTEILQAGQSSMMLYDIQFSTNPNIRDELSGQSLINITYILGTRDSESNINTVGHQCKPQANEYCAINKFDLTVRTLGGA